MRFRKQQHIVVCRNANGKSVWCTRIVAQIANCDTCKSTEHKMIYMFCFTTPKIEFSTWHNHKFSHFFPHSLCVPFVITTFPFRLRRFNKIIRVFVCVSMCILVVRSESIFIRIYAHPLRIHMNESVVFRRLHTLNGKIIFQPKNKIEYRRFCWLHLVLECS